MIYPKFLKNNSKIIVTAPSSGVGDKIENYEKSISRLENTNFIVEETKSVRNTGVVSNTDIIRSEEFNEALMSDSDLILIARGGEFLMETHPYLELDRILKSPKWVMGYSDPTSIMFSITTKYDVATLYGYNAGSYDFDHLCIRDNLNILKGNLVKQNSYDRIINYDNTLGNLVKWKSNKDEFIIKGRIIGGCIEVLNDLTGTNIHDINGFNEKYKSDGIIWYFDIYEMNSSDFYRTLLHFKYLDWFKNVKCILLSRINNKCEEYYTYEEVLMKVFPDIPYISDMCLGHTFPRMTIINGSIATVIYKDNSGSIEFSLE